MAVAERTPFASNRRRLIKDRVARYGVSAGGLMVLAALLLIFGYLLYVVVPIFKSASVEEQAVLTLNDDQVTLLVGSDELGELAYRLLGNGELRYQSTVTTPNRSAGQKLLNQQLPISPVVALARDAKAGELLAIAGSEGQLLLVKAGSSVSYPDNQRVVEPKLHYPLGEQPRQIDSEGQPLNRVAVSTEGGIRIAAWTADHRLLFVRFKPKRNMMTDSVDWVPSTLALGTQFSSVDELRLTPSARYLFVRSGDLVEVWDARDSGQPKLRETVRVAGKGAQVTTLALLSGSSSILVGKSDGTISQWFEVDKKEGGRGFDKIREFKVPAAVVSIDVERDRKGFYVLDANGNLTIFHATAHNQLWQNALHLDAGARMAVKPRANGFVVADGDELKQYKVVNEHPEISWRTLWQEVWYEGYPEPQYVWQSTSGSDSFEPKLSLVPITFGTIKAAFYAMLFGVPIALAGAIYTAYFMTPAMRAWVKPTVEIMEALPTVILGFLAGLWLAPLIEENLPGVAMVLIALPIGILLTAIAWQQLPARIKQSVPEGWEAAVTILPVIFVGWGAFALSPTVENWLFGGDARVYMTNVLGIGFDQRNAMIVGIAMGFAVIPNIFSIAEDAVFSVPRHLTNGSLALGANSWQTLTRVVLLTASPGIFSAVMMGLGRAVGETMIVLMATGNTPVMDWSIFAGMRTLSANIAVEMPESAVNSTHYRVLFLSAFVLFVLTFFFNTLSEFVRQRLRARYSSL
ncbi:MAG: ABC transporter permease subunit [Gammaproteobacteria bacterium]|nr:ABC transporter permease subunit [Gammaproteobacteria bacterium]